MPLLNEADAIFMGDVAADAVYLGDELVWSAGPPWSPDQTLGLVMWLDAADLPLLDGEAVSLWPDKSSSGHDLVVWEGGATAPTFKTAVQNGHPAVRFNGTSNVLSTQVQPPTYKHIFAVAKYRLATFDNYDGLLTGHDGNEIVMIGNQGTASLYPPPWTGPYHFNGVRQFGTYPAPMAAFGIMDFSSEGGWPLARTRIGLDRVYTPRYWDGDVAEVIAYDRLLTENERLQVENYLHKKWSTP